MRTLNLNVPKSFIELKPDQLVFIARLFMDPGSKVQMLVRALIYLSGLKVIQKDPEISGRKILYWVKEKGEKPTLITGSALVGAANHVKWILDLDQVKPLPWIRRRKPVHHRFYNASLDQYLMVENYFDAYQTTKKENFLDHLIATVYLAPWQKYKSVKITRRSAIFTKVSRERKETVVLWVLSLRKYFREAYPDLFFGSSSSSTTMREMVQTILRGLNKGDITKNSDLLEKPAHDALAELNAMAREAYEINKRMKNARR